jgi:hypothetical protein
MLGYCSPRIQYGMDEDTVDCCGYGGHQVPEENMAGVVIGGTGWAPVG